MSSTIFCVNAPPWVEVPTIIVGCTCATTSARPIDPSVRWPSSRRPPIAAARTASGSRADLSCRRPAAPACRRTRSSAWPRPRSRPSRSMTTRIWSAIPIPAVPAPKITTRCSRGRDPATRIPASAAASVIAPVPCTSSLKMPDLLAVLVEDPPRVRGAEVLEVQQRVREQPARRLDVGRDQRVVALAAHTAVAVTDIQRVVQQRLTVGAHVEHHRDHPVRDGCPLPPCRQPACRSRCPSRWRPSRRYRGSPRASVATIRSTSSAPSP